MNKIISVIGLIGLILFSNIGYNELSRAGDPAEKLHNVQKFITTFGDKNVMPLTHIRDAVKPYNLTWRNENVAITQLKIKIRDADYMVAGRNCQDCNLTYADDVYAQWVVEDDEQFEFNRLKSGALYGVSAYILLLCGVYGVIYLWRGFLLGIREISRAVRDK